MPAVLLNSQGQVLTNGTGPYVVDDVFTPPTYTGTVDREGLTALGWDSYDIDWLQQHVWWDKEDNDYWKVTEANLAFGPNGATPLTWANRATIKANPDVRYFPKFDPSPSSNTSWSGLLSGYPYLYAIPTHGWNTAKVTTFYNLFQNCYNLVSVGDLTNWSTAALTSSALYQTFYQCWNLTDVGDLSGWTTQNVTSMYCTFYYCYKLYNIGDLSNWNTAKVSNMSNMFCYCNRLKNIGDLSNWNTAKVTNMSNMFNTCANITHLDGLSHWNTALVTNMSGMFSGCYNLRYIDDLTSWNTGSVTNMASMFSSCYNLVRLGDLSNWDVSKVTSFYNMFYYCCKLNYIGKLDNWSVSTVNGTSTSSGFIQMFYYCMSLKTVGNLSNWTITMTGVKNQMNSMFNSCFNIRSLKLKDWDVSKVINFTYMFSTMRSLEELDVSGWDLSDATNTGTSAGTSIFANLHCTRRLVLGPKFFNSASIVTYYFSHLQNWTVDSIVESLYTNQTSRTSSSTLITIQIGTQAFDRLKNNLPEGFTLTDTTTIDIASKNIKLVRT